METMTTFAIRCFIDGKRKKTHVLTKRCSAKAREQEDEKSGRVIKFGRIKCAR